MGYAMAAKFAIGFLNGLHNRQQDYNDYANNEQGIAQKYLPYANQGVPAFTQFNKYNSRSVTDPTALQDQVASNYKDSPYQRAILSHTRQMMDTNNAQTGNLMSTQGQGSLENNLAGQEAGWMNNYVNQGMGQFNHGMAGDEQAAQLGLQALGGYGHYQDAGNMARFAGSNKSPGGFAGGMSSGLSSLGSMI